MHKMFYASGFLYNSQTQQILLQLVDTTSEDSQLTLFSGKGDKKQDAIALFQQIIKAQFHITIPLKDIHPVYDYENKDLAGMQFVCYAEINEAVMKKLEKSTVTKLLPLKKLPKLKVTEQVRQDITVGQRVINLIERERQEEAPKVFNQQR